MNPLQWSPKSVVSNLIMLNVLVFLAQMLSTKLDYLISINCALFPIGTGYFYPHQLVTYMFLHGDPVHLLFNMFMLWMIGRVVEYDMGSKRFLTYYMITGIGAGVLNLLVGLIGGGAPTVGASGAIFGLFLAYGMMRSNDIVLAFFVIPMKAKYFVMFMGLLEVYLIFTGKQPGVAHFAHLGGMIFGYFIMRYWKMKGKIYY